MWGKVLISLLIVNIKAHLYGPLWCREFSEEAAECDIVPEKTRMSATLRIGGACDLTVSRPANRKVDILNCGITEMGRISTSCKFNGISDGCSVSGTDPYAAGNYMIA